MKKTYTGFFIGASLICVLFIIFLATGLWKRFFYPKADERIMTRIVTPEAGFSSGTGQPGQRQWEDSLSTKIPLENSEILIAVINRESEEGNAEEQFAAYINAAAPERVYITFIGYEMQSGRYRRLWNAPTAASRVETISLSIQDLTGDRNNCVIVTGMNDKNEHTMTIFRKSPSQAKDEAFNKIAELQIDGSIIIQESGRSLAYQQGLTSGQSFNIAAYNHDSTSGNILDQIETIYSYNPSAEQYEQIRVTRIPGSQIEQRRLRELLSGTPGVFENFINDLWYYVSPQGTIDSRQYIYFDPDGREIIFFGDEAQQVFHWQGTTHTRYGLYVRSQNISITTLLRFIDIELESLDSIRLRVIEEVRLPITINTTWDGSYRRAGTVNHERHVSRIMPSVDAVYDTSWGRIRFNDTGEYTISSSGSVRRGYYVFYRVGETNLLELRPDDASENADRMVYRIDVSSSAVLSLFRVRIGNSGIQDILEPPVTLTPVVN
jgi:outer membrane protein assembly factor BamE (lipoprotein component of BamABCDE complex)